MNTILKTNKCSAKCLL